MDRSELNKYFENQLEAELFLRDRGLIKKSAICNKCKKEMVLIRNLFKGFNDREIFVCNTTGCGYRESIRADSFFKDTVEPLNKILYAIYAWSAKEKDQNRTRWMNIRPFFLNKWRILCNNICMKKFQKVIREKIGGIDTTVQIDTSQKIILRSPDTSDMYHFICAYQLHQNNFHYIIDVSLNQNYDYVYEIICAKIKVGTTLMLEFDNLDERLISAGYKIVKFENKNNAQHLLYKTDNLAKIMSYRILRTLKRRKCSTVDFVERNLCEEIFLQISSDPFEDILKVILELKQTYHFGSIGS